MSNPPGMKPPGWRRPRGIGIEREERQAEAVGHFLFAKHQANEAKKRKKAKKGIRVERLDHFRNDIDGRLHNKDTGRYMKDPTPQHRRTKPIIPWNKGKKTGKRKVSK